LFCLFAALPHFTDGLDLAAEAARDWLLLPGKAKGRHPSAACKELLQKKPAQAGVADCV